MENSSYKEMIYNTVGRDKYEERVKSLVDAAQQFIDEAGYGDVVVCNSRIMNMVVLDYYSDIVRLKDFHGIEFVRQEKIWAYTIAWIIRRKPLQYITFDENGEPD